MPVDASVLHVVNPPDGEPITTLPAAGAREVTEADEHAQRVFESGTWSALPPRDRAAVLLRLADLMERDAETLARLDSEDAGKPITECRTGDVPGAITSIRWFAEAADKLFGRLAPTGPDHLGMIGREPVGVVAAILPWNYPLAMTAWKAGPALAAGNCLLLKPAERHRVRPCTWLDSPPKPGYRTECSPCCPATVPSPVTRWPAVHGSARCPSPVPPRSDAAS